MAEETLRPSAPAQVAGFALDDTDADPTDALQSFAGHSDCSEESSRPQPCAMISLHLSGDELNDRSAIAARLGALAATDGVVFSPPDEVGIAGLNTLRFSIRLAHERNLKAWLRLDWESVRSFLGELDLASLEIGSKARSCAREIYRQIPEIDGLFLDGSHSFPPPAMPDLSRAFLDDFADRTGFSGRRYRLEGLLAALTEPGLGGARLRCDFAETCQDLAFRLLSNLVTEATLTFGERFAVALASELPAQLVPRPFDWLPDYYRFVELCPLAFTTTDDLLIAAVARSLARHHHNPIFVRDGNEWRPPTHTDSNVAVIVNTRAPLVDCRFNGYCQALRNLVATLIANGIACDLLTPDLMTTSEMTLSGGFRRGDRDYAVAIYPWPTIHTPYQWRELNGYLEEHGHAIFFGPGPMCLTDGTTIDENAKRNFAKATVEENDLVSRLNELVGKADVDVVAAGFMPAGSEPL